MRVGYADNIIHDCEFIRKALIDNKKWTVLGQSYGGFCLTTYLSLAPQGLNGAIITGGLPPLVDDPDLVYKATYKHVIAKNQKFYNSFPTDKAIVRQIVDYLENNSVKLTTGEILTARRFLQLGIYFGFTSTGRSMNTIHYLIEKAFVSASPGKKLSYVFLRNIEAMLEFNINPIYAILHEPAYCQKRSANWSAQKILDEFREFDLKNNPIFFTGEMVYPWMFDQYEA